MVGAGSARRDSACDDSRQQPQRIGRGVKCVGEVAAAADSMQVQEAEGSMPIPAADTPAMLARHAERVRLRRDVAAMPWTLRRTAPGLPCDPESGGALALTAADAREWRVQSTAPRSPATRSLHWRLRLPSH